MPVRSGARLGPYEILGLIGAGGMGEVYKARDTRLDRTVAIKVLPPDVASDPERRRRFEREAKTISALNHPHICTLHDVGEEHGTAFLVMEHLEGETLATRLDRGAVPLEQALRIGAEIADALAYAHRHDIVHRDLKPGNVMLTGSGVKLLDFGLAKLKAGVRSHSSSLAPTVTDSLTAEGKVLGTVPYMAPEQIEGKDTDARTDIFALGCVLYELVTGRRAFEGETSAALMSAILKDDPPPLVERQPLATGALDHVVRTCLAKDPEERWQSAGDVKRELAWIAEQEHTAHGSPAPATRGPWDEKTARRRTRARVLGGVGLLAGLMLGAWLLWPARRSASPTSVEPTHFITDVRPADALGHRHPSSQYLSVGSVRRPSRTAIALSTDGRYLVFLGITGDKQQLYLREWGRSEASPITGTEGADSPFFSPDGRWIGFWADGQLKKVPREGGQVFTLCDTRPLYGASWGADSRIVFAVMRDGLWSVSASGGPPERLTALDPSNGEVSHRLPQVLPGARQVLFTIVRGSITDDWQRAQVAVQSLDTGKRTVLVEGGADGRYVPTGHLVFARQGSVLALAFDLAQLRTRGEPVPMLGSVMQSVGMGNLDLETGATQLAVSASGTLVYVPGGPGPLSASDATVPERRLVWVSRDGTVEPLPAPLRPYIAPRLSPDARQIAVFTQETPRKVWVYDLGRQTLTRATTVEGHARNPLWTPDGRRLTFSLEANGTTDLVWMAADGSAPPLPLLSATGSNALIPADWSPDGRTLLFLRVGEGLEALAIGGTEAKDIRALEMPRGNWPVVSPDGHWLAYVSNESGQNEVYVRAFPGRGAKHQVSTDGGIAPAWARDGRELFYVRQSESEGSFVAVGVKLGEEVSLGRAETLFDVDRRRYFITAPTRGYDVAPDGRRFLFVELPETLDESPPREIHVVLNWFEDLKAKVPTGR